MNNEEDKNHQTEDHDDQRVTVQFIGVTLEHLAAHIYGGIAGSMGAKEEKEQQSGSSHYQFLADRRRHKSDKPHTRTL
jgi:hypothetical protein